MFEFFGIIIRLPAALALIAFLFITWPIGGSFMIAIWVFMFLITPFKFIGFAYSGDKAGWNEWVDGLTENMIPTVVYPFSTMPKIFKWVKTGGNL